MNPATGEVRAVYPASLRREAQSSSLLARLPIPSYLPWKECLDLRCGGIAHGAGPACARGPGRAGLVHGLLPRLETTSIGT